jgi:hypothetical protein
VSYYTPFPNGTSSVPGLSAINYMVNFNTGWNNVDFDPDVTMPGTFLGNSFAASPGVDHASIGFGSAYGVNEYVFGVDYFDGKPLVSSGPSPDMYEVNPSSGIPGVAPLPADPVVVASSSNTGSDLLVAWFEIQATYPFYGQIYYKFGGTSSVPSFKTTSVANVDKKNTFSVHPAPATEQLYADGVSTGIYDITDVVGREIQKGQLDRQNKPIDISHILPGNYIISVTNDAGTQRTKFTKQ